MCVGGAEGLQLPGATWEVLPLRVAGADSDGGSCEGQVGLGELFGHGTVLGDIIRVLTLGWHLGCGRVAAGPDRRAAPGVDSDRDSDRDSEGGGSGWVHALRVDLVRVDPKSPGPGPGPGSGSPSESDSESGPVLVVHEIELFD